MDFSILFEFTALDGTQEAVAFPTDNPKELCILTEEQLIQAEPDEPEIGSTEKLVGMVH